MIFNYLEMVKEAVATGQPVERSIPFGDHGNAPASVNKMTIDTTAVVPICCRPAHSYPAYAPIGYTREQLKHLVAKWPPRKQPNQPKEGIALAGKDSFSSAFNKVLGTANTNNIHGPDDNLILEGIFEALLEQEASSKVLKEENKNLMALTRISEQGISLSVSVAADGSPRWSMNGGSAKGQSWTGLLCAVFNLSRMDAIATLANILGMLYENLFQLSSDKHIAELNASPIKHEDVPEMLYLRDFQKGSDYVVFMDKYDICGNAGQVIGAILRYRLNGHDICLPATVGRGVLCMGKYKPTAHFLNQDLMDKHPLAKIIFCQDMRTALAFQRLLDETRSDRLDEVIVTAHLGNDLSVLPWTYFHDHNVVFAPAPTMRDIARVGLYEKQIMGAGGLSFNVFKGFLLHSAPSCDLGSAVDVDNVKGAEAELLHNSSVIDDWERPSRLVQHVFENSISYEAFKAWGQASGIFKAPKGTSTQAYMDSTFVLPKADPALSPAVAHNLTDVTLHHIMRPGNYVVLLGAKGAGKTQVALSTCNSILKGNVAWPLFRGADIDAGNIAYIDAETPFDEYCDNLKQHGLANEAGRRFFGFSKFAPDLPEFCNAFLLTVPDFREGLLQYLLKHKCRYVFLDNLTALMGDGVHQGKAAQDVLNWVEGLQKHGLCVVFVHHKAEYEASAPYGDKARGSQLFIIRARTVIALKSRTEIMNKNITAPETVRTTAERDGLTVGIHFQTAKTAPVLEKKTLWLHLPLGASTWQFLAATGASEEEIEYAHDDGSILNPAPVNQANALSDEPKSEPSEILDALSDKENKVYRMAQTAGSIKTADIAKELGVCPRTARSITKSLEEKDLLEPDGGKGPQQGYRVKT